MVDFEGRGELKCPNFWWGLFCSVFQFAVFFCRLKKKGQISDLPFFLAKTAKKKPMILTPPPPKVAHYIVVLKIITYFSIFCGLFQKKCIFNILSIYVFPPENHNPPQIERLWVRHIFGNLEAFCVAYRALGGSQRPPYARYVPQKLPRFQK